MYMYVMYMYNHARAQRKEGDNVKSMITSKAYDHVNTISTCTYTRTHECL